jgi:hypothetical protein
MKSKQKKTKVKQSRRERRGEEVESKTKMYK